MPEPRYTLTEDEHERFVELGNEFYLGLSKLVAEALDKCPAPDIEDHLLMYLSDRSSVYGSAFERYRTNPAPSGEKP